MDDFSAALEQGLAKKKLDSLDTPPARHPGCDVKPPPPAQSSSEHIACSITGLHLRSRLKGALGVAQKKETRDVRYDERCENHSDEDHGSVGASCGSGCGAPSSGPRGEAAAGSPLAPPELCPRSVTGLHVRLRIAQALAKSFANRGGGVGGGEGGGFRSDSVPQTRPSTAN